MVKRRKRGRPMGWRKKDAQRAMLNIRVDRKDMAALRRIAREGKYDSVSDLMRDRIRMLIGLSDG